MSLFPSLETERLLLRPLAPLDLEFVYQHFTDPDVNRFLHDEEPAKTREDAQAIVDFYTGPDDRPYNRWLIVTKADEMPIGTCGYHNWYRKHSRAEIGYDLTRSMWHQGFMTEALASAIAFGFEEMKLHRVEAMVSPHNHASIRLLERLGFRQEGLRRDYYRHEGLFHDCLTFALLDTEWWPGDRANPR